VRQLDRFAVVQGVLTALMVVVPALALNAYLTRDGRESSLSFVLMLASFAGWILGAGVAAWVQQRRTPYTHGLVAALVAWAVPQLILIVLDLDDDGTNWLSVAAFATFVAFAGLLGGVLGNRLQSRGVLPSTVRGKEQP
jgi:putative membrane protein (TIGR04086 family)